MQYLLDTVTIVRHLSGKGRIGKAASKILDSIEEEDHLMMISVISLMEIMYLSEKNRINIDLNETLERINKSSHYTIIDLTPEILQIAENIEFPELHDRLILATAKWLDIPIISSDKAFRGVSERKVIWK